MNLSEVTIDEFFKHLKQNPEDHTIPKRYISRIRNLVYYYFIGWHPFATDKMKNDELRTQFKMYETHADILKTIDYSIFATTPKTGPGIIDHLKNTVALYA